MIYYRSSEYNSYIHDFFMETLFESIKQPLRILDFGCGEGLLMSYLKNTFYAAHFVGYDSNIGQIQQNQRNFPELTFMSGGGLPLPFKNGSFDLIYLVQVMHHIEKNDQEKYMTELVRILRPGGYLCIIEPNNKNLFERYRFSREHFGEHMISSAHLTDLIQKNSCTKSKLVYLYPWLSGTPCALLEKYCRAIPLGQLYCLIAQKNNKNMNVAKQKKVML